MVGSAQPSVHIWGSSREIAAPVLTWKCKAPGMANPVCNSHKDLLLWQKALAVAVHVHQVTAAFPRAERFGLVAQMRRAAVSIPSNVAEGSARRTTRDFAAFLHIARGSLAELETQMWLACRMGYASETVTHETMAQLEEIGKMLNGVLASLRRRLALTNR